MNRSHEIRVVRDRPAGARDLVGVDMGEGHTMRCGRVARFTLQLHDGLAYLAMGDGTNGCFVEHTADELEKLAHACLQGVAILRGVQ